MLTAVPGYQTADQNHRIALHPYSPSSGKQDDSPLNPRLNDMAKPLETEQPGCFPDQLVRRCAAAVLQQTEQCVGEFLDRDILNRLDLLRVVGGRTKAGVLRRVDPDGPQKRVRITGFGMNAAAANDLTYRDPGLVSLRKSSPVTPRLVVK